MLIIGDDFNLPDINWIDLTITGSQYPNRLSKSFLEMVADNSREQLIDFPTRKDKILDIFLTTHPSFKQRCKPMPSIGNSDHDNLLLDTSTTVRKPKPLRRKIFLWKRADIQGIKDDLCNFSVNIEGETDVNQGMESKKISNDQEPLQSDTTSCLQNPKGNN